eukprot:7175054-Karenia_brevis.AAC.1
MTSRWACRKGSSAVKIGQKNITILVARPRLLVVGVATAAFRLVVISAHAPHSTSEDAATWWDEFVRAMWDFATEDVVILGIDANLT